MNMPSVCLRLGGTISWGATARMCLQSFRHCQISIRQIAVGGICVKMEEQASLWSMYQMSMELLNSSEIDEILCALEALNLQRC
mmetsp:Transcript_34562/g.83614  ORF Transcript_34562/g.83614 Transcript_34562/m.83614 type:complete len:84 (-) Transcript_34562:140-391(-)